MRTQSKWSIGPGSLSSLGSLLLPAALLFMGMGMGTATGCGGLGAPAGDDIEVSMDEEDIERILREVFPALTDEEVHELAAKLDLDAVVALRSEMDEIRAVAADLSKALDDLAAAAAQDRAAALEPHNGGFPLTLEPAARAAFYDSANGAGRIELSGIFRDRTAVDLMNGSASVMVGGNAVASELSCLQGGEPVDIVFLVDITGSMSSVIGSVRRSLGTFVDAIVARGIKGTLSVVTFQDTVGVNVTFQEPPPAGKVERSPFFKPVAISDAANIEKLQRFITRLEANSGTDLPENLAAAVDFARNGVIGETSGGQPNVVGDGVEDPPSTSAFPALQSARQVFVAVTDAPFHSDSRTPATSSLLAPFKPRPIADILKSLQATGTTVHVSDPSWGDQATTPTGGPSEESVDSDYWAINTGGLGQDRVAGYSLVDLDLLVVAEDTGLLDIVLDGIVSSSCTLRFPLDSLAAGGTFDLEIEESGEVFSEPLTPIVY